jgi:hypothetical protein
MSTKTLIRAVFLKLSKLLHPNSKQDEFYIYKEHQQTIDPFYPSFAGFTKNRFAKFDKKIRVSGPTSFGMLFIVQS